MRVKTTIAVIEQARAHDVIAYNVVVPNVCEYFL